MGHVPVPEGPEGTVMGKRLSRAPQADFYGSPSIPREEAFSSPEKSMPEAKTNKQKYHVAILEIHSKLTGRMGLDCVCGQMSRVTYYVCHGRARGRRCKMPPNRMRRARGGEERARLTHSVWYSAAGDTAVHID